MTHFSTLSDSSDVVLFIFLELVFLFCPILLIKELIAAEGFNIHLNGEEVWMNQEKTDKYHRVQYEARVKLCDIQNMKLVQSTTSSKGKPIIGYPQHFAPKTYLVFLYENDKETWMNVTHFTYVYLEKIIRDILHAKEAIGCQYSGSSSTEIVSDFLLRKKV